MVMFDEVLPIVLAAIAAHGLKHAHIVRDVSGSVVVVLPDSALDSAGADALAKELHDRLGKYSPGLRRVLLRESDLVDPDDILNSLDKVALPETGFFLVDRLLTNQDWLREPLGNRPPLPTLVAFSVKGGVGRSTALAMFSWALARQGKRVVVVDLDLEAPGIGSMLVKEAPQFGLIDWLTEAISGEPAGDLLEKCIAVAPIGLDTAGTVSVIPAYGEHTGNYVAKLGRIYMPSIDDAGRMVGLAERLKALLEAIESIESKPDVVLMDARAGLHDIGSAAVTRLGAEALLFARNDPQNWWAFEQLFDHLSSAKSVASGMGDDNDLRWKLKMVAAQTEPREDVKRAWAKASYDVWNGFYDDETAEGTEGFDPQVFDRFSPEAPHYPLYVNFDPAVRSLILTEPEAKPDWAFIRGVFGEFFVGAAARLWPEQKDLDWE